MLDLDTWISPIKGFRPDEFRWLPDAPLNIPCSQSNAFDRNVLFKRYIDDPLDDFTFQIPNFDGLGEGRSS